ncbi:uncharacterized protein SETTUDRAFT_162572 [Exserohilum turcica Et28A]|uniref:Uncharacterized protein n=1 Tax=Exserohilum turcicum (strain 28A) TaxID=671987 RepID=R0KWC1_EXST2|nr:uncharacterized protein SETTUDRAFT_162572 [Exserohilum turcica Et28A]EOA92032.1 hypothetical protein SETTUDRAFT_162572 [Exserohilum turcica Et28A]
MESSMESIIQPNLPWHFLGQTYPAPRHVPKMRGREHCYRSMRHEQTVDSRRHILARLKVLETVSKQTGKRAVWR